MTSTAASTSSYRPVPAHVDLPALEHEILDWWRENKIFRESTVNSAGSKRWTFYEGPPTANGTPGTHHVEARTFKDIFPRFKTMQGFHVDRKAGWDCHGLPVEIAVEKELGFNGKPDIEAFGIAEFNERCRESVLRNVDLFEEMTDRMGYWVDMSTPYRTMDSSYVQSVWWALQQIFDKGLLVEDFRVAPYCPRCGTTLSDHELAQGYETVVDPSIYVRFGLTSGPWAGANLLVWTTTPWTLVSNTAIAVNPAVDYVLASDGTERVVVADPLFDSVLGENYERLERISGQDMERWAYQRPFDLVDIADAHFVVLADYVTTEDGTGLVHQAPAFGADDMATCRAYGLPVINPIKPDGHFDDTLDIIGGQFFKTADSVLLADLESRGLLYRKLDYEHSYPHCWRCHTPLMYFALPAWYVRTTVVKDNLLAENEATNWFPDTIKHGRYGDWLDNNIDWALSRNRYWGTPLPIWRNDVEPDKLICVGSLAQLSELTGRDLSELDPHRPFIDDVTFTVPGEAGVYRRVPEVIDAWFDSGSMPFAQWGYPHAPGSAEQFGEAFPAQYICEAIDQTRGWFYSLMAVNTLVFGQNSYENVVCLGHILAEDGRKMSKHLGNVLLPIPLMNEHGADALRWFMACSGSPWSARRIGHNALSEIVRKVLLTYWNTVAFQALYARASDWNPSINRPAPADRDLLDQWLLSESNQLILDVTSALEQFDTQRAGQRLADFLDDLSNWYVRRSRKRFWRGDEGALSTLHEVLDTATRLLAPIAPFITERVWQDLFAAGDASLPVSVHLTQWPTAQPELIVAGLSDDMSLARRLTELGRAARAEAKVRTRQPLRRALVSTSQHAQLGAELRAQVCDELNIGDLGTFADADSSVIEYSAKANFRALGRRFGKQTPVVAQAIAAASAEQLADDLATHGSAELDVAGEVVSVNPDEVIITERPSEGWSVANEHGETVALDLQIDDELRLAGLAREAVRVIQEARKSSGLDITDRISIEWAAEAEMAQAISEHSQSIADEVLAVEMLPREGTNFSFVDDDLNLSFSLAKR